MSSAILYISALIHLPIANANAIMQLTPVAVTATGAIFFGEKVGWRRWTAIAVALIGVFIIVRPGFAGFNIFSLLVLAAMLVVVARDMATRAMDRGLPALPVSLATALVVTVSGPIVSVVLRESWLTPPTYSLAYLFFAAIFLIGGYLSSVVFMRHGDIAVVAPFRYSGIVWATLIGFIVWHELPDWPTVLGTLIVVATGVYTFQRERRLAMAKAAA
jgi:drug/metabolite transporter (DMT)-like permease